MSLVLSDFICRIVELIIYIEWLNFIYNVLLVNIKSLIIDSCVCSIVKVSKG